LFHPNLGPFLAAAPAVLIAFSLSPEKALHVALLYLGIQTVESFFITPLIQRKTVLLPPALTGAAQLVLGLFTGLPGIIVAAPLTATTMVLVRRFYVEDTLGDETVEADEGG
jgi:predicted PurR-regulated permease PerM